MSKFDSLLQFAIAQATDAGAAMRDLFQRSDKGVELKPDHTSVTVADKSINEVLITAVNKAFPKHGVLGEEASIRTDSSELWVCDPVDGTKAFILGIPTAMFSLAYVRDGVPLVAVAYDPFVDRMYTAVKGEGAFKNSKPIHVRKSQQMQDSTVVITGSTRRFHDFWPMNEYLLEKGVYVEKFPGGVIKCCLVAEGLMTGHIFPGTGAHDIAACKLIVEEAGGRVTDLRGQEQRYDKPIFGAIISNGDIHDTLVAAVDIVGADNFIGR